MERQAIALNVQVIKPSSAGKVPSLRLALARVGFLLRTLKLGESDHLTNALLLVAYLIAKILF